MNRKKFIQCLAAQSAGISVASTFGFPAIISGKTGTEFQKSNELAADVIIVGGGLGGCAAALAALRNGRSVIMTEETDWIGGQLTQQGVPPDEHQWIETHGCTRLYRQLRTAIRSYYKRYYPLTSEAKARVYLNPGDGAVSRLCHEPRVALAVLREMLAPYLSSKKLTLLLKHRVVEADTEGNKVHGVKAVDDLSGGTVVLKAPYFFDATELGDLLSVTGTEYVTGTESRKATGELHATEKANAKNQQAFTYCFAMDYVAGSHQVTKKPENYEFWRNFVPDVSPAWHGKLLDLTFPNPSTLEPRELGFNPYGTATGKKLNLWDYRRIINRKNFKKGTYKGDITIVNWPQNDYMRGNLMDVSEQDFDKHIRQSKQLSHSLFYWLQTEVPRPDGGQGWPGLRLRPDIMGTDDGLAKYPYIRESRRIKAVFTVLEEHVGRKNRALVTGKKPSEVSAAQFDDTVGIGYYHIDLHPTSAGNNYIDFDSLPFQIPLGALLPQQKENVLPACKNIGTTHITNGCYRLHPVEWNIGESVGMLVAYTLNKNIKPHVVREDRHLLEEFQNLIRSQGIETHWPEEDL